MKTVEMDRMDRGLGRSGASVAALALFLVACAPGAPQETPAGPAGTASPAEATAGAAGDEEVALIAGYTTSTFYVTMECGARAAADELGVDLNYTGSTVWDINEQMPIIEGVIQREPDGVVLAPTDAAALVPVVEDLMADGVPVVTVDAPLEEPVDIQNLQSNHRLGGEQAAEIMLELTGGEGTFLAIGMDPGLPDIDARVAGFVETMEAAGAELLPVAYPGPDSARAAELTAAAITANPDIAGVYASFDGAGAGAASAIVDAGQRGEIKLIAWDTDPVQVRDLRDGVYDALIGQSPYWMGYESVTLVTQILRGEVDPEDVEYSNPAPTEVITRENVDDPEVQSYLAVGDSSECPTGPPV